MEFLTHLKETFLYGVARFTDLFSGIFSYFISIGVREETLLIILIAGGISLLILFAAILLSLSRIKIKSKTAPEETKKARKKPAQSNRVVGPNPAFAIFKKRKKAGGGAQSSQEAPQEMLMEDAPSVSGDHLDALTVIERDMLALKELHATGHITLDVYVQETKKLYDQANNLS